MLNAKYPIPFVFISINERPLPMRDVLNMNHLNAVDSTIQTPTI